MDDALPVRIVQRFSQVLGYLHRFIYRKLLLTVDLIAKGVALDVGHDVVEEAFCFP